MCSSDLQWVFDNAETVSINRRKVVGQTISRSNQVRSVNRGGQAWRFEVKLPDGMAWDTARPYIEAIDQADKVYAGLVKMNNAGYTSWLNAYRGDSTDLTGWTADVLGTGYQYITLTNVAGMTSGYTLRQGDWIELQDNTNQWKGVYSVVEDVTYPNTTVLLNKPYEGGNAASLDLVIGPECEFQVICSDLPAWTIFARNQVSWSGNFTFYQTGDWY